MNKTVKHLLTSLVCGACAISASAAHLTDGSSVLMSPSKLNKALGGMTREVIPYSSTHRSIVENVSTASQFGKISRTSKRRASAIEPAAVLPGTSFWTTMEGPDGNVWYATADYTETDGSITHFTATLYNSEMELIGSVEDDVALFTEEGETRIALVEINPYVTSKFFNFNSDYEIMVYVVANTGPEHNYQTRERTLVYQLGKNKAIETYQGNCVSAINAASDAWTENYYLSFMYESATEGLVYDTYKKAGYSSGPESIGKITVNPELLSGDSSLPFISTKHNGKIYIAVNRLEKPFFESNDWENENLNPDNSFIIDLYAIEGPAYSPTFKLVKTTTIPCDNPATMSEPFKMFYLGQFLYNDDITFGVYDESTSEPCYIVTLANYQSISDDFTYDFKVYNSDGQAIGTIGENAIEGLLMQDIPGQPRQALLISSPAEDQDYLFNFVNFTELKLAHALPQTIDGESMSASIDRIPSGGSYLYISSKNTAVEDSQGNTYHSILFIDPSGSIDHIDRINLGKDVAMAYPYISGGFNNPYTFNTNNAYEYAFLVKRFTDAQAATTTQEEFMVIDNKSNTLMSALPTAERKLASINFITNSEDNKKMCILWRDDDWTIYTDFYNLPLESLTVGDGTEESPYLITSIADMQQIRKNTAAYYSIANDIDASGYLFSTIESFSGSIDGNGHSIKNLIVDGSGIFGTLDEGAKVQNIKFEDCEISSSLIAENAINATISGIHVDGMNIISGSSASEVGGLVDKLMVYSTITESSITRANLTAEKASIGGLANETRTGATINACYFEGSIKGNTTVGGIVGYQGNKDDVISNCHVDANIEARSTVGGVVGSSNRGSVYCCYVEGRISANGPAEAAWDKTGPCAGGIVGYLIPDYAEAGSTPIIYNNVVNLSSLTGYTPDFTPDWERQAVTTHRIVGWTAANDNPEDQKVEFEKFIADNYATMPLSEGCEEGADNADGATIAVNELTKAFLESIEFAFGDDVTAPWVEGNSGLPELWFENLPESSIPAIGITKSSISFDGVMVKAEGQTLRIYTATGLLAAKATDTVSVGSLAKGIYIVEATDAKGARQTLKISVK